METLRSRDTKEKLRLALVMLLKDTSFEQVTVANLCRESGVSRITFYAYYDDKFQLAGEIFSELFQDASVIFQTLQAANNPSDSPEQSCRNLLSAILKMQKRHSDFMEQLALESNSYLAFSYYWYVLRKAGEYGYDYVKALGPKYDARMTVNFLSTGIWGFIRTGIAEKLPTEVIERQAEELLTSLLRGKLFPAEEIPAPEILKEGILECPNE